MDRIPIPLHILIVDSNHLVLKLWRRYLMRVGSTTVVSACNGVEAVAAVRDAHRSKNFDLIFMDISVPGMDGLEVERLIRSLECDPLPCDPSGNEGGLLVASEGSARWACKDLCSDESNMNYIVALTDSTSVSDQAQSDEGGFDEVWTKPVAFSMIGSSVMRWNSTSNLTLVNL